MLKLPSAISVEPLYPFVPERTKVSGPALTNPAVLKTEPAKMAGALLVITFDVPFPRLTLPEKTTVPEIIGTGDIGGGLMMIRLDKSVGRESEAAVEKPRVQFSEILVELGIVFEPHAQTAPP